MKHDYKKHEKEFYQPKQRPEFVHIPPFNFFILTGEGNPNRPEFSNYIEALYSASYAVKMSYKSSSPPPDFYDYTVYPLEGVWSLIDPEKGIQDKSNFKFDLMIRQPTFLTSEQAKSYIDLAYQKKKNTLIKEIRFVSIQEGPCVQMLHIGSYDDEPASFEQMENYCDSIGYVRASKVHREIYLSDARKTSPEKLKTILRFLIHEKH